MAGPTDSPAAGRPGRQAWPLAPVGRVVVEVRCRAQQADLVAERLFGLGASAVSESSSECLVADLDLGSVGELEAWLDDRWPASSCSLVEVDPAWADGWRDHASVVRAGRVVVRPAWIDPAWIDEAPRDGGSGDGEAHDVGDTVGDRVEVVVDPRTTFGSGSHETTRMCLALLGDLVRGGETVLDVGVGSGILSMAALRLGASLAGGVDIDPAAEAESVHCAELNRCGDRYRFLGDGLGAASGPYDIVLANLLVGTIEGLGAALAAVVRPGGSLVLSGFLEPQADRVLAALGARDRISARLTESGWVAVVVRAGDAP